jgi:hypothetical protein
MISVHLFDGPTGPQILDLTPYVRGCPLARGVHGDSDVAIPLNLPSLGQQLALLERVGLPWLEVHDTTGLIWAGRVENPQASSSGELTLTAYGPWRAVEDARDTALWSTTSVAEWFQLTAQNQAQQTPDRYTFDTNNRLYIAANKGDTFGNAGQLGSLAYAVPHRSTRLIQNIAFDYVFTDTEGNWEAACQEWTAAYPIDGAWTFHSSVWSLGATGSGSICAPFSTGRTAAVFRMFRNAAAAVNNFETDQNTLRITNVRLTSMPLAVNTTLQANALLGATVIDVFDATNIAVGMTLYLGGTNPEKVTVTSVTPGFTTIGVTALAAAKAIGNTVRAQRVLASDVASSLAGIVSTLNPALLQSGTNLIQQTTADLTDLVYEDLSPAAVLEARASAEQLSVGVTRERLLWMRPRDLAAYTQAYAVDASDITLGRTIEELWNARYAVYQDASGRTLRTTTSTAAQSVARWGVTRQQEVASSTTSLTAAERQRDLALADTDDPPPQAAISFTRLYTLSGAPVALTELQAGDTLTIRNLSLTSSADIDQLATVRLARVVYDPVTRQIAVEFENPPASLEVALAAPPGSPFARLGKK